MAVSSLKRTRRRHKDFRIKRDLDADLLWERPSDWPTLPEVLASQSKVVGLYKVENHDMNHISFTMGLPSGTYTVDWGDGTQSAGITGTASHTYDYSDTDLTLTSEGFKVAVITITTDAGQSFNILNFNVKNSNYGTNSSISSGWLEMKMSLPGITSNANFTLGNGTNTVHRNCRSFEYVGDFGLINGTNLFVGFISLENLKVPKSFTANMTTMTSMFNGCTKLKYVPDLDTSAMTNGATMFSGCTLLRRVPAMDWSHSTTMQAVFQNCSSLEYIPDIGSIGNASTCASMFQGCSALKHAPAITSNSSLANTSSMFLNCTTLESIPVFNTSGVTNAANMFQACSALEIVPAFDFSALNSTTNAGCYTSCNSLRKILATGVRFGHSLAACQLSSAALDVYYTNLGTASGAQTLTVSGNQVTSDNPAIATAKGWTVSGS